MPKTQGQNFQDVNDGALPAIGAPARTNNESIMSKVNANFDSPLRLYASFPSADGLLNIRANQTDAGDGTGKSSAPADDIINAFPDTTIDFQTAGGAIAGGTVTVQGAAFALPDTSLGNFRRMAMVYQSGDNRVDVVFSDQAASVGALTNVGILFASLDGLPLGWIDLECTDATASLNKFKTAGSSTDIIENEVGGTPRIVQFGGGAGLGGGGDTSFKVQSINANVATIKKGTVFLDDGRQLFLGANLDVDLLNDPLSGVTAPAASTAYHLYIDLESLADSAAQGDTDKLKVTVVADDFVVLADGPEAVDLDRYVPIAGLKTDGASDYTLYDNDGTRRHQSPSVSVSPLAETVALQAIGSIGSAGQIARGHVLSAKSFPLASLTALASFYNLNTTADGSGNGNTLTNNGGVPFTGVGILGDTAPDLDGATHHFSNTAALFNPGDTDFTVGAWVKAADWTPGIDRTIVAQNFDASDRGFTVKLGSGGGGTLDVLFADTASTDVTVLSTTAVQGFANDSWHHIAIVFRASDNRLQLFIDGVLEETVTAANAPRVVTSPVFRLGSRHGTNEFFDGVLDEVFYVAALQTPEDIAKYHSARIDLTDTSVDPTNQDWSGRFVRADGYIQNELDHGWLLDKRRDCVFVDFGGDSVDQVELYKFDLGQSARVRHGKAFDRTYTADPTGTVAHGLPALPTDFVILHDELADGKWAPLNPESYVKADATNLYIDTAALTIDGTHPIRIIARIGTKITAQHESFGYTMFVNAPFDHPKNYADINAANAAAVAGDRVLVFSHGTVTVEQEINVDDTVWEFMPGAEIEMTGGVDTNVLIIRGNRIFAVRPRVKVSGALSLTNGIVIANVSNDCEVSGARVESDNAGATITNAYRFATSCARSFVRGALIATAGTITNQLLNEGTDNDGVVRG